MSWRRPEHREYPRVPTLEEVDHNDLNAVVAARDQQLREDWVGIMATRMLREELKECYRKEGVNHLKKCRKLAVEYVSRIRDGSTAYKKWDYEAPSSTASSS